MSAKVIPFDFCNPRNGFQAAADRSRHAEQEFEAFWAAYPRRQGNPKHAARLEWVKLARSGALPELSDAIAAAKAYRAHCANRGIAEEHICHARTWLSQRRWLDWVVGNDLKDAQPSQSDSPDWTANYPGWAAFRATMHPARWQVYFGTAQWEADTQTLIVGTAFERDKILETYAEDLQRRLGYPVTVICRTDQTAK